jgi:thioredoxin-dependent peroxiredoxin
MSTLKLGDIAPDFTAETTEGTLRFHEWIGNGWAMLFSHPKDFTPVCTTELGAVAKLKPEFDRRHCKIVGLSVDSVEDHRRWSRDIKDTEGTAPNYPLIGDSDLKVAKLYGMLPADVAGAAGARTAADNATVRSVFLIGPDKKIKLMITYPMSTGRDFREILRVLDSCQLTATHKVATPANWKPGEKVIIVPSVPDDDARRLFPEGWEAPKPYLRYVPQPRQ